MLSSWRVLAAGSAVGLACVAPAWAVLSPGLYGVSSGQDGAVYAIDTATGAATLVVSTGRQSFAPGAEFFGGKLFATNLRADSGFLEMGSIDPDTGAFSPFWDQGFSNATNGLAADEANNVFYFSFNDDTPGFGVLDATTGQATFPGSPAHFTYGLAFDANHNVLYGADDHALYTIDPATAQTTEVGPFGGSLGFQPGLAYDPLTDTLYLNAGSAGNLYRIDTATGAATLIGSNNLRDTKIEGLAFLTESPVETVVPEPVTAAAVAGAMTALVAAATRRKRAV
jgi:DNA-binding beta-propeller fold protein YncE